MAWNEWQPYVPVYARRAQARREMEKLRKRGVDVHPVEIEGRKIARTFWGEAWCDHLEQFSDYANRLPRGRSYVRNGSVCHLAISEGVVEAMVSGSELYQVRVEIGKLPAEKWKRVKEQCAGRIGSLLELLQGRLSDHVMAVVGDRDRGLFPHPREIRLQCSCPDWAVMCKHVAAVLYGVGARLDEEPELLFVLRGVDHVELIGAEVDLAATAAGGKKAGGRRIAQEDLSDVFGIELAVGDGTAAEARPGRGRRLAAKPTGAKVAGKAKAAGTKAGRTGAGRGQRRKQREVGGAGRTGTPAKKAAAGGAGGGAITGRQVVELRHKLDLSQNELGLLLDVSGATVGIWERRPGPLRLYERARVVLEGAAQLTRDEAWMWLEVLSE